MRFAIFAAVLASVAVAAPVADPKFDYVSSGTFIYSFQHSAGSC